MKTLVPVLVVLALASAPIAAEPGVAPDTLEERMQELRVQGRYAEAADVARELLELRRGDPEAKSFEVADAERLVETLVHIAGLPHDTQRAMARADSLTGAVETCWGAGRYAEGAAAVQRQLDILRRVLGSTHPDVAESLNNLAVLLNAQGDYAGAEPLYREALAMRRQVLGNEHPEVANSLNNLAYLLYGQGDYVNAEPLYREALVVQRGLLGDEHADVAVTLNNLAGLLQSRGDYAGAEQLFHEVLAMRRSLFGSEHPSVATSLSNLAALLQARGDYAGAESLLREALAMRRKLLGEEHPQVAKSLGNLAALLQARGDYAAAEPLFRRALATQRTLLGSEHPHVATSLNNLAALLQAQGDYAGAEPLYREALAMLKKFLGEGHPYVAQTLNNLAVLLQARGDYAGAEPLYREALGMHRRLLGDEHPHAVQSLHSLAYLLQARGDYAGAEPLYREALAMWRKVLGDEHPHVAAGLSNLAALLQARGDYAGAEPLYREALAMWRELQGNEHPDVAGCLSSLGTLRHAQGDCAGAESLLVEAARVYDAARLRVGAGLKRTAFQTSPYPRLASVRLTLGRTDGAWPAVEKAHARSLADLLMAADERDLSPSESAREDSLKRVLGDLERELAVYREAAANDTTGEAAGLAEATRNALLAAESEWSAFQEEIVGKYPVTEGEVFPLGRVQSTLSEDAAIIGWLDVSFGEDAAELWCYAIRSSGPVAWERAGSSLTGGGSQSPTDRARSFRERLADPASPGAAVTRESRGLWGERIEPLGEALEGVRKLVVVPSGAMLGVPVEVLVDNERAVVGDTYAVSYVPSATIYTWLAERAGRVADGRTLLVGDPPYNSRHLAAMQREEDVLLASADPLPEAQTLRSAVAGNADALNALPRLCGTRTEVSEIAGVCRPSSLLLGVEATEQELGRLAESGELGEFGTIHIATHALVDDEEPGRSALVLSQVGVPDPLEAAMAGARIYDGLVTAQEILREWDLNADLVTLSACETGLGKAVMGEGYVGFAHAFLQAGARSLLVSLWKVEDTATSLLMLRFYENWLGEYDDERGGHRGEPMSKAEALQEAKQWLRNYTDEYGRRPYEHPYYWSAFTLMGDPI